MGGELRAVSRHRVRLLVVVGKATFSALATSFVATRSRVEAFLVRTPPPFIAKLYRAKPDELAANPDAAGRVELWYPR